MVTNPTPEQMARATVRTAPKNSAAYTIAEAYIAVLDESITINQAVSRIFGFTPEEEIEETIVEAINFDFSEKGKLRITPVGYNDTKPMVEEKPSADDLVGRTNADAAHG